MVFVGIPGVQLANAKNSRKYFETGSLEEWLLLGSLGLCEAVGAALR